MSQVPRLSEVCNRGISSALSTPGYLLALLQARLHNSQGLTDVIQPKQVPKTN